MQVGRDLVTCGELQSINELSVFRRIAKKDRDLRAFWKSRRRGGPLDAVCSRDGMRLVGCCTKRQQQCGGQSRDHAKLVHHDALPMDYHRCRSYKGAEELGIEP